MEIFKLQKAYGINWLKNNTSDGGAQKMVIESCRPDNIVISSHTKKYGRMWADVSMEELKKIVEKDICLFEIIYKPKSKVYFDVDKINTEEDQNYLNKITTKINELFPNPDMAISGSILKTKYSYHIILNNYVINSNDEKQKLINIVKYLKNNFDDGFDDVVYKNNQLMKQINQSKITTPDKPDKRVQAKITHIDNDEKHFITTSFNNHYCSIDDAKLTDEMIESLIIIENKKPLNMGTLPKVKIDSLVKVNVIKNYISINTDLNAEYYLNLAPLNPSFPHSYTFFVELFCFSNDISLDRYIEWYKQKHSSIEKINIKKSMWNNLHKYDPIPISNFKNMLSKYYPCLKMNKNSCDFDKMNNIDIYDKKCQIIDNIDQSHFNNTNKYLVFNVGMGSGKTAQTIDYLKNNKDKKFLFISPNQALSFSVYDRMLKDGLKVEHYNIDYANKQTKTKKHKTEMNKADNLIICINSLHYLDYNKYDIVICDEIETINNKWFDNATMTTQLLRSLDSWEKFKNLLKEAKKVILLDAFITKQTLELINDIDSLQDIIIYKKKCEISNREMDILPNFDNWLNGIICKLNKNKKVFIFYPFKTGNKDNISMEGLSQFIKEKTNKTGKIYNSGIDDELINELKDVNKNWVGCDYIITNSKITVGVNFDINDYFDCCFISLTGFSSPRDVVQASCRARYIISNKIYVVFLSTRNINDNFKPDSYLTRSDQVYTNLINNVIIEKTTPIKHAFYVFCKRAGYKIHLNKFILEKQIDTDYETLISSCNLCYDYDSIKTIEFNDVNIIQNKMIENMATSDDKAELKKYFFIKKFQVDSDIEMIREAWNKKFNFFFEQLEDLVPNPFFKNILEQIRDHNKFSSFFPSDKELNKVKLNNDIIDEIFKCDNKWFFLRLNPNSGHKTIYKTIINSMFKMNIIESKREKSNNTLLEINDCSRDMLNFGINNLKIYHKLNTTKNILLNDEIKNNKLQARGNASNSKEFTYLSKIKSNDPRSLQTGGQSLDVFEDDE